MVWWWRATPIAGLLVGVRPALDESALHMAVVFFCVRGMEPLVGGCRALLFVAPRVRCARRLLPGRA